MSDFSFYICHTYTGTTVMCAPDSGATCRLFTVEVDLEFRRTNTMIRLSHQKTYLPSFCRDIVLR